MVSSKRRQLSSSDSEETPAKKGNNNWKNQSNSNNQHETGPSPAKKSKRQSNSKRSSDSAVRFRHSEMITKYKNRNPNIQVQSLSDPSQLDVEDIASDDEVWIFQAPASMNVSKLVGKTLKLGSKTAVVQTDGETIECVTEKAPLQKSMTMICPQRDTQLTLVSFTPAGTIHLRSKDADDTEGAIDFNEFVTNQKVPFPDNLKVRHPILGADYETKLQINEKILAKLKEPQKSSTRKSKKRSIKTEHEESQEGIETIDMIKLEEVSPKKRSSKRKLEPDNDDEEVPFLPKKKKTQIETEDDTDLAWIKQL